MDKSLLVVHVVDRYIAVQKALDGLLAVGISTGSLQVDSAEVVYQYVIDLWHDGAIKVEPSVSGIRYIIDRFDDLEDILSYQEIIGKIAEELK